MVWITRIKSKKWIVGIVWLSAACGVAFFLTQRRKRQAVGVRSSRLEQINIALGPLSYKSHPDETTARTIAIATSDFGFWNVTERERYFRREYAVAQLQVRG